MVMINRHKKILLMILLLVLLVGVGSYYNKLRDNRVEVLEEVNTSSVKSDEAITKTEVSIDDIIKFHEEHFEEHINEYTINRIHRDHEKLTLYSDSSGRPVRATLDILLSNVSATKYDYYFLYHENVLFISEDGSFFMAEDMMVIDSGLSDLSQYELESYIKEKVFYLKNFDIREE